MLDPLAVRPLVVEPVAADFVVCEDEEVRLTDDLVPEGDTVLMRVLEVPVLLTLLLTVVVMLLEVPLTSLVAVLVRVPVWVEADLVVDVLFWSLSVLLAVRASAVVMVFVWVAACCASRT